MELLRKWNRISLVKRIIAGLLVGTALGILLPQALFAGGFRRLRAASYFAHGGSSSQWPRPPSLGPSGQFTLSPLVSVSA